MSRDEEIRLASLNSLVEVVKQDNEGNGDINLSLLVLQTWLEQFARTNGGISPSEYCAPDRVRLLQSLMTITDNMTNSSENCNTNAFRYVNQGTSLYYVSKRTGWVGLKVSFFSVSEIPLSNLPKEIFQKTILSLKFE